jgi:Helix-turn-helix domain
MRQKGDSPCVWMSSEVTEDELLLNGHEAARLLGLSPRTLKYWRAEGHRKGPPYVKLGDSPKACVRYSLKELRRFISSRTVRI